MNIKRMALLVIVAITFFPSELTPKRNFIRAVPLSQTPHILVTIWALQ